MDLSPYVSGEYEPRLHPRPMALIERILGIVLILMIALTIISVAMRPAQAPTLITPAPPPGSIRWEEHAVGGYLLVSPDTTLADSARTLVLPPGSMLEIPHRARIGEGDERVPGERL